MPFYSRPRGHARLQKPILWSAGLMLLWTVARVAGVKLDTSVSRPGIFSNLLYIVLCTVLGGAFVGGFYWSLDLPPMRKHQPLRWAAATLCTAAYIITFALAATRFTAISAWDRLSQPTFLLSTAALSIVFGWVVGKDLFGLTGLSERLYLSPAEYTALSAAQQAELRLEDATGSEPLPSRK